VANAKRTIIKFYVCMCVHKSCTAQKEGERGVGERQGWQIESLAVCLSVRLSDCSIVCAHLRS